MDVPPFSWRLLNEYPPGSLQFDPAMPYSQSGRTSSIFKAKDLRGTTSLALKRRRHGRGDPGPSQREKAESEAAVWKDLCHDNILRLLGYHVDQGIVYLVTPFAPWGDILEYIKVHDFDANRSALICGAAAGLSYLHGRGLVHGDIKATNILVMLDGTAVVSDLGSAGQQGVDGLSDGRTESLTHLGPESIDDVHSHWTYNRDTYAFGITVSEILSCQTVNDRLLGVLVHIMNERRNPSGPPMRPSRSPSGESYAPLWAVAQQCWRVNPDERPPMSRVHAQLAELTSTTQEPYNASNHLGIKIILIIIFVLLLAFIKVQA